MAVIVTTSEAIEEAARQVGRDIHNGLKPHLDAIGRAAAAQERRIAQLEAALVEERARRIDEEHGYQMALEDVRAAARTQLEAEGLLPAIAVKQSVNSDET